MTQPLRVAMLEPGFEQAVEELAGRAAEEAVELVALAGGNSPDLRDVDAVIVGASGLGGDALRAARPRLQHVQLFGRHFDRVDWRTARELGMTVGAYPRKGAWTVAELALTLIMAVSKELLLSDRQTRSGAYRDLGLEPRLTSQRSHAFQWMKIPLREVRGSTVGIIGLGEIGGELALRLQPLEPAAVLYHKRTSLSPEAEAYFGVRRAALDELLRRSDFVVLAVPHTPETERMINAETLALMREDAYLINVCRGGVVDEDALADALRSRRIRGAALDVFLYEPLPADHPFTRLDNVLLTPHIGGGTGTNRAAELWGAVELALAAVRSGSVRYPLAGGRL